MRRTAAQVAVLLAGAGLPVLASSEGNDDIDGMVEVTPIISVQVATDGEYLGVVIEHPSSDEDDTSYEFWPSRSTIIALMSDVQRALALYGSTQ